VSVLNPEIRTRLFEQLTVEKVGSYSSSESAAGGRVEKY